MGEWVVASLGESGGGGEEFSLVPNPVARLLERQNGGLNFTCSCPQTTLN